jgi:signal transduction histidine kinase
MLNWTTILQSPYYYFNFSSLIPFVFCNLTFFMGFFILVIGIRSSFHRAIFYFYVSASLWFLGYALSLNAWVDPVAFFWGRVVYLGIILVPVTMLHVSLIATQEYHRKRFFIWFVYLGVLLFFSSTWGDSFFVGVKEYPWGFFPEARESQFVLLSFSLLCSGYAVFNILRHYFYFVRLPQRRESDRFYKRKLQLMLVAFIFAVLGNIKVFNNYGISIYPFDLLVLFLSTATMGYALIKYHESHFLIELRKIGSEVKCAQKQIDTARHKLVDMGKASIFASLSAGILHQMCQPITAVHGLAKFMRNNMKTEDPYYKSIDLILEQSCYMKEMLNDLMDLVRHKEVKRENININDCVDRALRLLRDEMRIKRVNWDFFPDRNVPCVYADAVHLQETFMNIVVNALDNLGALPKGKERYLKIFSQYDRKKNEVLVYFENTGEKIAQHQKENIFEPFMTTRETGIGIGLALCKDLMVEHGGDITAENIHNEEDTGVSFCVRFPAAEVF